MTTVSPGWYADPSRQHELRYWDGSAWTGHAVSAAAHTPSLTQPSGPGSRRLGWAGVILGLVAVLAVAVPAIVMERAEGRTIELDGSRQTLSLTPDTTYGIWVDDADNSGYSSSCSAYAADNLPIRLSDPSFTISQSDTGTLDHVFDSGSGAVSIICAVPGERVTTRPYVSVVPVAIGVVVASIVGTLGLALLIAWVPRRVQVRRARRAGST